jgi:protein-tyrosine phosphatase
MGCYRELSLTHIPRVPYLRSSPSVATVLHMSIGVEVIPDPAHEPDAADQQPYFDEVGPERALHIAGVLNARDVGGLIGARGRIRTGLVLRAACLHQLTDEGAKTLADLGLKTVIDLRTPRECREQPNRLTDPGLQGVTEVHIEFLKSLVDLPGTSRELYRYLTDLCGNGIVEALEYLARPNALPALVHCLVGKDRTGLLVALLLELLSVPRDAILADYIASNAGLGPVARTQVQADVLDWTLEGLTERYGSPRAYLDAHGLTDETVAALQAALIEP